ncbi:cell division ATPase MinD [Candidatus Woesearchaeota archaeon]|nr:cell division ATPase MinD [Candidatus Woesearchaeota archaeon]
MKMTKFIVVASGKGGVGRTTTAINLATALNSFGREVILVDANLSTPHIGIYLGSTKVPVSLHDVLSGEKHIKEALYQHRNGLKVIPASISIKNLKKIKPNLLEKYIQELTGSAEIVIVDSAAGLGEEPLSAIKACDEVIIVTTPDLASVTDALKTIKLCEEHNKKIFGIIVNKVKKDDFEMAKENIEFILENTVIALIPDDDTVRQSLYLKTPVTYSHPNTPAAIGFKKLAANILGEKYVESIEKKDTMLDIILKSIGLKP